MVSGIQQSFDDLGTPLIEVEFVVLDFETTGGSPGDDRITEVGAVKVRGGEVLPLCRLRYAGSATVWGFAVWLASKDGYQDSFLPSGRPSGTPQEALDCACGLYLGDPTAWSEHRS